MKPLRCAGDCISQPGSLSEEEPRNLRWVGSLPPPACEAPPSLEPLPFNNTPEPPLGPATSSSRLLRPLFYALRGEVWENTGRG